MSPLRFASILALACGALMAADPAPTAATTLSSDEIAFIQKAHACGQCEVRAARLAVERQVTGNDLAFANRMITDHQAMQQELTALAAAKQVALQPQDAAERQKMADAAQKKHDALANADAEDVAEKYLEQQIDAHQEAIEQFEEIAESTQDAELRAYANRHLPTLRTHLQEAKRLEAAH